MSRIYVANHVTLDGVIQGPGRADEDTRDGFGSGGWAARGMDDACLAAMNQRVRAGGGMRLLLGRRSYEAMLGYWNTQDSPFKEGLNRAAKYIASNTLTEPLPWPNSTVLSGDVAARVAKLKTEPGADLCIMGSGVLIQTLMAHGLIDEFLLFVHPIVLAAGRRIFPPGGSPVPLHLADCQATPTGVLIASYHLVDDPPFVE